MARFSIRGGDGGGDGEGSSINGSRKRPRPRDEGLAEKMTGRRSMGEEEEEEEEQEQEEEENDDHGDRSRSRSPNRGLFRRSEYNDGEDNDWRLRTEADDPDIEILYRGDSDHEDTISESRLGTITGPFESRSRNRPRHRSPMRICSNNIRTSRDSSLSVTLDSDILDCNICYEPLTIPIFQCDNGHIACSSCCTKLRNKCPSCSLPIGYNRCRAMEKVLESARIPCLNSRYGCLEKFPYASPAHINHEKNCSFFPCACPRIQCSFLTSYKQLQVHYKAVHKDSQIGFKWDITFSITLPRLDDLTNSRLVLQEEEDLELFVLHRFRKSFGESVSMSCIAPSVEGTGEYSYSLLIKDAENSIRFDSRRVAKIQRMIHSPPESGFLLIPYYLSNADPPLKFVLNIRRTGQTIERLR